MSNSRVKRENIIILPNKDKLPTGKIKDVSKFLNMVSAEYNIEEDMGYFFIEKDKCVSMFKLRYIPRELSELHSINAKKFVMYELIRSGYDCVIKTDDELNKRAFVINDNLNKIDDTCKETINSKLNTMFDIPGELDYLLDQLLTDPQFNSFKYTVLDEKKTTCLLCINGDGLFVRCTEAPYEVLRQLSWQDIDMIKIKSNKLIFGKKNGENEEIVCNSKKIAATAIEHLWQYHGFVSNRESSDTKRSKGSWFGSFAHKIRQSFSKRNRPHDADKDLSAQSPVSKSSSMHRDKYGTTNSTIAGSSVVSEDGLDTKRSAMEPSISTNSTHYASVGSAGSFKNSSYSHDKYPQSSITQSGQDDHVSVKTTSTYEVSFESPSQRTISNDSRSDHDSTGHGLASFGQTKSIKSPPTSQIKGSNQPSKESVIIDEVFTPPVDPIKQSTKSHDTKIVAVPPPQIPIRTCQTQMAFQPEVHYPQFETIKLPPPPPPIRSTKTESHEFQEPLYISPPTMFAGLESDQIIDETSKTSFVESEEAIMPKDITLDEQIIYGRNDPIEAMTTSTEYREQEMITIPIEESTELLSDEFPMPEYIFPEDNDPTQHFKESDTPVLMVTKQFEERVLEKNVSMPVEVSQSPVKEDIVDKEPAKSSKGECKLPVYQRKSIPSPKIQRPSRIPSISSARDPPSPPSSTRPIPKIPSPSDKENYNSSIIKNDGPEKYPDLDDIQRPTDGNFSRFTNEEYTLDSKTTITSKTTTGDSITKKSTKTEISSVKTSGIPAPKQYKTTTTVTSTVKKPSDPPKSPVIGGPRVSGIPRMSLK